MFEIEQNSFQGEKCCVVVAYQMQKSGEVLCNLT